MRYFGFKSLDEVNRIDMQDYKYLAEAFELRNVDIEEKIHKLAWLSFAVKAMKGKNKQRPVYGEFKKFFDYKKEIDRVKGKDSNRFTALSKHKKEVENSGGK